MSETSTTRRNRRWHDRAVKALVGVSTICAMVGVGFLVLPGSEAATTKAKAAEVDCSTFAHSGISGVVINEANDHLKRTFVEHGPGTGFFKPEPQSEIPAKTVSPWCVGSHFGVEAMKVDYQLPDGAKAEFQAFYAAVVGSLETSCSTSSRRFGCAAEKIGPNFVCSPYVGCVGPLRDKNALKGVDVVFRVFPR